MNIGSIDSKIGSHATPASLSKPEAAVTQKSGRDKDADTDEGGAKSVKAEPAPTVNLSGQKLGQVINVSA